MFCNTSITKGISSIDKSKRETYISKLNGSAFIQRRSKEMHCMAKRIMASMAVCLFLVFTATATHGSEVEVLMKMLLKKGMITEADYNEVMNELKGPGSIEQRVQEVEKKTSEVAGHVDKHIIHAEDATPAKIGNLNIGGGVTMVGQGTSGNDKNDLASAEADDAIDGNASVDLEVSVNMGKHGEAFLAIEAGNGDGLADEFDYDGDGESDLFWGFNADAGDNGSNLEVTEAWYEHMFMGDMITFTIGKLDPTNYFDGNEVANDETTQFLADGFVNDATVEFPSNGPRHSPDSQSGRAY